jgi:hypothetical protein
LTHLRPILVLCIWAACCWAVIGWNGGRLASAAPIKVACIGGHTTHSDHFAALNRESQPPGKQEYPAMLQTLLGSGYDVRNFGDCCASVLQGYTPQETHPYVLGALAGRGPGYAESLAFMPDIVIIGSWGRHDWGQKKAATEVWNLAKFQTDYDDLVQRYQKLASHPRIFVSLPIPIPFGELAPPTGVATSTVLPAVQAIASKYNLPIIDLYAPFLNHKELFKQPPDPEGEGEHVTDDLGLHTIANTVYAAMVAYLDGGVPTVGPSADAGFVGDATVDGAMGTGVPPGSVDSGAGTSSGSGGSSGSSGGAGNGTVGVAETGAPGGPVSASPGTNPGSSGAAASSDQKPPAAGCACTLIENRASDAWPSVLSLAALALLAERRRRIRNLTPPA